MKWSYAHFPTGTVVQLAKGVVMKDDGIRTVESVKRDSTSFQLRMKTGETIENIWVDSILKRGSDDIPFKGFNSNSNLFELRQLYEADLCRLKTYTKKKTEYAGLTSSIFIDPLLNGKLDPFCTIDLLDLEDELIRQGVITTVIDGCYTVFRSNKKRLKNAIKRLIPKFSRSSKYVFYTTLDSFS